MQDDTDKEMKKKIDNQKINIQLYRETDKKQ